MMKFEQRSILQLPLVEDQIRSTRYQRQIFFYRVGIPVKILEIFQDDKFQL